ncbi:MAG: hypothetical protein EOP49_27985 [Sphingobacteriales bacterium]|nr:MAG: hypothetical protein EOP49_27985 [Sphingobacteriales bacterium]
MKTLLAAMLILTSMALTAHAQEGRGQTHIQRGKLFTALISGDNNLEVTCNADGVILLKESLMDTDAGKYLEDTTYGQPYRIADFNFDGYDDIANPSNSGNVQRFEQVYLYDPVKKALVANTALSDIACLDIDPGTKTVSGNCFHTSAAENWTETYQWQGKKLILVEREGTLPGPGAAEYYYQYRQKRVKGKMVYVYKRKVRY